MYRFLLQRSSRSLLLSPTSRRIGSVFAGNLKARLLPFPKFAISNALMSSSSAPDSDSSGFKEGSSDPKKTKKPRKPKKTSATVPVVSLEASRESGLSPTGTSVSAQQDEAAWSYKGMSKMEVKDQIAFLNKTLRDMVFKTAELESDKMKLLKKTVKSATRKGKRGGSVAGSGPRKCGVCGKRGHNARSHRSVVGRQRLAQ